MPKKVVKDVTGHDVHYEESKPGLRAGDDKNFIKRSHEMREERAKFVREHSEYHKKTPKSVRDKSPYADATGTNDMRPSNPANAKARAKLHSQVTPGKWNTKELKR